MPNYAGSLLEPAIKMRETGVLIAFGELFLKSTRVKKLFQRKLAGNITYFLKREGLPFSVISLHDRIFIATPEPQPVCQVLASVFGISWFARASFFRGVSLEEMEDFFEHSRDQLVAEGQTYALRVKRSGGVKVSTRQIIERLARKIRGQVNLDNPEKEIFLEARKEGWFLYFKKEKGSGGLPVSTGGRALALISGGIDSPVAAYGIARRGVENVWLHFHSFPLVSRASWEKTEELAKVFLKFQKTLRVYYVPFHEAQIKIRTVAPARYRVLLYRRLMLRVAQTFALKEKCQALVTGESLGQVSSQTLANLAIIEQETTLPVLRPLISLDKEEIIHLAKKIGTYDISIRPQEDCCTLFVPKRATARGNLRVVEEIERELDRKEMVDECVRGAQLEEYS